MQEIYQRDSANDKLSTSSNRKFGMRSIPLNRGDEIRVITDGLKFLPLQG